MRFFGGIALALFIPAVILAGWLFYWRVTEGKFTGQIWAGFSSAALTALGLIFLHMGILGDMLNRHRIYLEELLFDTRMLRSRRNNTSTDPDEYQ